jgi:hypothetical protein
MGWVAARCFARTGLLGQGCPGGVAYRRQWPTAAATLTGDGETDAGVVDELQKVDPAQWRGLAGVGGRPEAGVEA